MLQTQATSGAGPVQGDREMHARFLSHSLPMQPGTVARHLLPDGRTAWIKKAGPRHGRWRYWLMGALAGLLRLGVLRPVPNLGGEAAIAREAQRLRELWALGLRVPEVLAQQADGLLLADLGAPGQAARSLGQEMDQAVAQGAAALLPLWQDGLDAIALVHARGSCLSQAFARNLVRCPDGAIGYIDFEDDPRLALSLAQCQARDWLSYLHATAVLLHEAGALPQAAALWRRRLDQMGPEVRAELRLSAQRMAWMRRLPAQRRWGRDVQRLGAAAQLMALARADQAA
ncbi:hypothetical protein [Ramlibacter sp. 2FC]|uniref:hypothetical protein n=1 Tax=Ramlibacter sp. 2FC TaxID=2502188 RepID=UPI00148572BC|nr:hypothetical protein [Ramlibacter sp. 2FC]